jgi:hypothetical protein
LEEKSWDLSHRSGLGSYSAGPPDLDFSRSGYFKIRIFPDQDITRSGYFQIRMSPEQNKSRSGYV